MYQDITCNDECNASRSLEPFFFFFTGRQAQCVQRKSNWYEMGKSKSRRGAKERETKVQGEDNELEEKEQEGKNT